jgi:hypothetical protein
LSVQWHGYTAISCYLRILDVIVLIQIGLLSAAIMLVLLFIPAIKHMHKLALSAAWMLSVYFEDAYFTIFSLNLEWIDVSERMDHVWVRVLGLYMISPLLVVWTVDAMAGARRVRSKLTILAAGTLSLMAVDAALDAESVWSIPADWPLWGWVAKPLLLIAVVAALVRGFRSLMRKEGLIG